jgi:diguanylate cyclase (GGDEF)-like protein
MALLVPEGLLLLAGTAAVGWPGLLHPAEAVLPFLPPLVLVAGLLLAWRFDRGDVFVALVALAAAAAALEWAAVRETGGRSVGALRPALALLLPANLTVLALLPNRGALGVATGRRMLALLGQAALLAVLARPGEADRLGLIAAQHVTTPILPPTAPLGDAALIMGVVGMGTLSVLQLRRPTPLRRGFLWALAAVVLAFALPTGSTVGPLTAPTFLCAIAALSLGVAVLETAHALAYRDGLTGLPNRRALDDALRRQDGPFTIAMVDVDHFKACNDTHGHAVGDQVLRMVAAHLDAEDAGGQAYRYGGEEFAILFPGQAAADVAVVLEAIRAAVAAADFTVRGADRPRRRPRHPRRKGGAARLAVTVSIGAAHRPDTDGPPDDVIRAADAALYRAKEAGRNRVEVGRGTRRP